MNIRVISDLHVDVNRSNPLELDDKNTFTVVAGDVTGDPYAAVRWLKDNVHNGIVVAGNHIVYNKMNMAVESIRDYFAMEMPIESNLTYLDCLAEGRTFYKGVGGILFLGSTLYTDYGLPLPPQFNAHSPEQIVTANMREGKRFLNDFVWGNARKNDDEIEPLAPKHYLNWFNETIDAFDKKLAEVERVNPDAKVVVVTHHCPTVKCVAPHYRGSSVNSSFVSDLEWFIEKHPSIKLWVCGHVHNRFFVKVGQCSVVANPRGYCCANEDSGWNQNLTIDSNTWNIL